MDIRNPRLPQYIIPPSLLKQPSIIEDEDLAQLSPTNIARQEGDDLP